MTLKRNYVGSLPQTGQGYRLGHADIFMALLASYGGVEVIQVARVDA